MILCGGAINSPQLLQLSGVGNAAELEALGVDVVADLPGVGENLQDHLEVYVQHASHAARLGAAVAEEVEAAARSARSGCSSRSGPGATNHFEAGGFVRSNEDVAYPNLMFHFLPLAIRYDGSAPAAAHGYQVHVGPMYSDARGSVKIVSTDPRAHPALRFNYLSTDQDRREWVEAIRVRPRDPRPAGVRAVRRRRAVARPGGGDRRADPRLGRAATRETALHPSCTCAHGHDASSTRRRCASTASTGCASWTRRCSRTSRTATSTRPVMMVAEKAADLIRGDTPLPAEPVDFYRHDAVRSG